MQAFEKKKTKRRNIGSRDACADMQIPACSKKHANTRNATRTASVCSSLCKKDSHSVRKVSSRLQNIYSSHNREESIAEFIESASKAEVETEIKCLSLIITDKSFDLGLSLFMCETLSVFGYNYELSKAAYRLLDIKSSCKYSIYKIRLLKCLQRFNGKRFLPISAQILETIENAQASVNRSSEKRPSMDSLKVSSDNISEEFFVFILEKCLKLLFKHLDLLSNSIAFPDLVFFILERLRALKRHEEIKRFIVRVENHSRYVDEERKKLDSTLNMKAVSVFEKSLKRMSTEA